MTTDVPAAVLPPLRIGPIEVTTPVELAPMAGVTNASFRRLCRLYGESALPGALRPDGDGPVALPGGRLRAPAGLYVTEMVTTRALVERNEKTLAMVRTDPGERVRSIQLYGVDPSIAGRAVRILVEEDLADHIDLNFGCPVPKVTRKGGGAALPWKRDLMAAILRETVRASEAASAAVGRDHPVPVTVKTRVGVDEEHETYLDVARAAADAGVAALALHGRTARQHYAGHASWETIARLKEATSLPVLGNGDLWTGDDALRMVRETGCDGVVVGRGCQGRPWLFADIVSALHGSHQRTRPDLDRVIEVIEEHGRLLAQEMGEQRGVRDLRKHVGWYLKGYPVGGAARDALMRVGTLEELHEALAAMRARLPEVVPYPGETVEGPRGRAGSPKRPHLPEGWLDSPYLTEEQRVLLLDAESDVSGG
ncbi:MULTISPECIES: tRNA dihydrouridine synthase DusB [unclassified Actinomyces]|uniref:tRNA dihydrouridine synthase DusB n=1 Tax=unclassified Actinomyces TaxID=2609248 RepID=UPI0020176A50|nr:MULTISPECIES: tRNA dihydrouridine synthase DusB [unclassified Actinomyces]MCL3776542.1 tRNA dihydrouridine synthase DusB [Actinomyces sp. AC-20-1]MCL3789538.1 tRNA dihydrouridine synthase DusB [Actinomyces sp. 187325]MCL3791066.1 tRNA dihydrouridine synthase DusB [Actinomyces sp. 186855]MCL3793408.1 tRNA dihydrouridine synthase DusB [Actinomyces sp. 217892]